LSLTGFAVAKAIIMVDLGARWFEACGGFGGVAREDLTMRPTARK
jgi:hypothetical protein